MLTVTERAATKLKELMRQEASPPAALRVRVRGGGCSGLRYELAFDGPADADHAFEQHGLPVCVDASSAAHLEGSTLDFADGLNDSGFQIANPNAATTCGCGESFGV